MTAVFETHVPELNLLSRGQVRDIYEYEGNLLMVATDRLSVFDVVLPTPIPNKGKAITQMCRYWFKQLADIVPNHFITDDVHTLTRLSKDRRDQLAGRTILCRKADVLPVDIVVRGYLTGSGWDEYVVSSTISGVKIKKGMKQGQRLEKPMLNPGIKKENGQYKRNLTMDELPGIVGADIAAAMERVSVDLYIRSRDKLAERGLIIADTKFVFGLVNGELTLIDEVLTSDSSRIWPKDNLTPGKVQASFDKQFIRDYLDGTGWNHTPPAPDLPQKIVDKTVERYLDALEKITGETLANG
ncbi:MAG: phosphoribosylaminoimidazolesuccinocarboxamide synthase [Planctomycetota bacterium]